MNDFSWEMNNPLFTKERNKTRMFKFFILFSKIWKIEVIRMADKTRESADFWPISTSIEKKGKIKPFHK